MNDKMETLRALTAISKAAERAGLDDAMAIFAVIQYGSRNKRVHSDFRRLIREGNFPELARCLLADLTDTPALFQENETNERVWLVAIVEKRLDTWFDRSLNPLKPNTWTPKQALKDEYYAKSGLVAAETYKKDKKRKADLNKEISKRNEMLTEILNYLKSKMPTGPVPQKRKASFKVEHSDRKEVFRNMDSLGKHTKHRIDYKLEYESRAQLVSARIQD